MHLSCSHLSLLPAWSGCLSLQSFPNLDGHTYTHTPSTPSSSLFPHRPATLFFLSLPYFTLALATYGLTHYTFHIWICGRRIKTCLKHLMWILCHGESLLSLQSLYCSLLRSLLRLLGYRVCVFSVVTILRDFTCEQHRVKSLQILIY